MFAPLFLSWGCASTASYMGERRLPVGASWLLRAAGSDFKWEAVEVGGRAEAEKFMRQRLEAISDLVSPNIDPYKGVDSVPVVCRKENLPSDIKAEEPEGGIGMAASLYSSRRKILGLCSSPQDILKTQYLLLYCGKSQVYVIQYFYEPSEPWLKDLAAHCTL
jgi:hypothetical protein